MNPSISNISVPIELIDQITSTIKHWEKNQARKNQVVEALDCDNKMNNLLNDLYMTPPMWARANVYKTSCNSNWRNLIYPEIIPDSRFYDDPRRPVLMKGSLECLYRRYSKSYYGNSCGNGWSEHVVERYIRRSRFTSLSSRECYAFVDNVMRRIRKKHYTTYHFDSPIEGRYKNTRIVGGKIVNLEDNQIKYLKRLDNIRKKTIKLENSCALQSPGDAIK